MIKGINLKLKETRSKELIVFDSKITLINSLHQINSEQMKSKYLLLLLIQESILHTLG